MTEIPLACTLSAAGARDRSERWRRLLAAAETGRERTPAGLRLTLRDEVESELRDLVAAETECCPFLALTVRRSGGELILSARAAPDARPILEHLLEKEPT